jgi:hypothetical protein
LRFGIGAKGWGGGGVGRGAPGRQKGTVTGPLPCDWPGPQPPSVLAAQRHLLHEPSQAQVTQGGVPKRERG